MFPQNCLSELFLLNYAPLLKKTLSKTLPTGTICPICPIGRIAAVKMTRLPKINYIFSVTPVQPTSHWFNTCITTTFYWKHKSQQHLPTCVIQTNIHTETHPHPSNNLPPNAGEISAPTPIYFSCRIDSSQALPGPLCYNS